MAGGIVPVPVTELKISNGVDRGICSAHHFDGALRKFGKATIPDFIGDRYYSDAARLVAVICAIFICMTYIMGQMRGVG